MPPYVFHCPDFINGIKTMESENALQMKTFHCPDFINGIKTSAARLENSQYCFTARISLTGLRLQKNLLPNVFHCPDFINGIKTTISSLSNLASVSLPGFH